MRKLYLIGSTAAILSLSACSSVIEGSSQQISVNTNPPGADCQLKRNGETIANINSTPGSA